MTTEPQKSDWMVVSLALLAGATAAAYVGKASAALPLIRGELNLTIVEAGWTVSLIAAMAMATGVIAGMTADKVGHRRLLIIGLLTLAVSSAAGSVAGSPGVLLVTRFFESVGFISVAASAPALVTTSILARHREVVLGVWGVWFPVGIALSMIISPLILGPLGWRGLWVFWAVAAIALVAALLVKRPPAAPRDEASRPQPHSFLASVRLILGRPGPLLLALNFAVFAAQWGSMMTWIPSFLVEQRSLPVSTAAVLGGLVVAVNIPGNLHGSWLLHRGVKRRQLIGYTHLAMAVLAVGIFSDALPDLARYGLALAFSFAAGYLPAGIFASGPVHAPTPSQYGAINGMIIQGSNTGNFFGPPAVAAVVAAWGAWSGALWLMLACAGAGIALTFWLAAVEKKLP